MNAVVWPGALCARGSFRARARRRAGSAPVLSSGEISGEYEHRGRVAGCRRQMLPVAIWTTQHASIRPTSRMPPWALQNKLTQIGVLREVGDLGADIFSVDGDGLATAI